MGTYPLKFKCTAETPFIRSFVFGVEGGVLPRWQAGAHVGVTLSNGGDRPYSLMALPSLPDGALALRILRRGVDRRLAVHARFEDRRCREDTHAGRQVLSAGRSRAHAARRARYVGKPVIDEIARHADGSHLLALWQMRQPDYPAQTGLAFLAHNYPP